MSMHLATPETAEGINLEPLEPLTIRILEDGSHTGHRAGLIEGSLPPGSHGPPQHIHREHDEMFFVVSGTVRFISGAEHLDVPSGGLVTAPIGTPHTRSPTLTRASPRPCRARSHPSGTSITFAQGSPNTTFEVMSRYATEPYRLSGKT